MDQGSGDAVPADCTVFEISNGFDNLVLYAGPKVNRVGIILRNEGGWIDSRRRNLFIEGFTDVSEVLREMLCH